MAVSIFIICVVLLTLAAVLAIWDVVDNDVLWKSISTIAVLGFAALITVGAAKFMEDKHSADQLHQ